ncbi:YolD-like family protein [Robertmurraya korlensis]|uniref:YolD-like family protein n=1 Tax=Robertmurraya korlensis TaxID=519977 RepID=UPI002040F3D1|nr:YolD-like family protein [Robertmurraya korlensis]MCM3601871.1 YolD-like family protein [Robertmurraya korlensis]
MFLKKLSVNKLISIDYYSNGSLKTIKGRVYKLDLIKQSLLLKDETHKPLTIQFSGIRHIY